MILMHGMAVILILAACLTGVETMEMSGAEQAAENLAVKPGKVETEQLRSIAEQNAEAFLKEFFSFNKDDRRTLLRDIESADEQGLQGVVTAYYNAFVPYTEQACIEEMARQRIPLKYDRMCGAWVAGIKAKEVSLEEIGAEVFEGGTVYDYTVLLEKQEYNTDTIELFDIDGQITVDAEGFVKRIYVEKPEGLERYLGRAAK